MADFGAPVAAGVQGPQAGLQTLSSLMGLQQQKLGIARQQIGLSQAQQQLSQETSQAQLAALKAHQTEALSHIDVSKYRNPDGTLNMQALTPVVTQAAPLLAPQFLSSTEDMATAGANMHKALLSLNKEEQEPIMTAVALYGSTPDMKLPDAVKLMETRIDNMPKPAQGPGTAMMGNYLRMMAGNDPKTGEPLSEQQRKAMSLAFARSALGESEIAGPGGVGSPGRTVLNTGGALVPGSVAPLTSQTPGKFTPQGEPINTTLGPQIFTQAGTGRQFTLQGGQLVPVPAQGGPIAGGAPAVPQGATTAAQGGGPPAAGAPAGAPNRWLEQALTDPALLTANTHSFALRAQAGEAAANSSPTAIDALSRGLAILDKPGVDTGTLFSSVKDSLNALASAGLDTKKAQNMSELAKNLARYEASRAGTVGDTDAARSLYESGAPNTKMDAKAVRAVIMQSLGVERMIQGYAKVVGAAPTIQAGLSAEQKFRSIPNLVQAYELGFMKNKAEADEFFKRYGVSGPALAKSAAELKALGAM